MIGLTLHYCHRANSGWYYFGCITSGAHYIITEVIYSHQPSTVFFSPESLLIDDRAGGGVIIFHHVLIIIHFLDFCFSHSAAYFRKLHFSEGSVNFYPTVGICFRYSYGNMRAGRYMLIILTYFTGLS